MFESLKGDIATLSAERDNIRAQVHKYIELLEKTYAENEALRAHIDGVMDENSKLKDNILQMQQMLNQSQQQIYAVMLQKQGVPQIIPQMSPVMQSVMPQIIPPQSLPSPMVTPIMNIPGIIPGVATLPPPASMTDTKGNPII